VPNKRNKAFSAFRLRACANLIADKPVPMLLLPVGDKGGVETIITSLESMSIVSSQVSSSCFSIAVQSARCLLCRDIVDRGTKPEIFSMDETISPSIALTIV
jgi:hypothetical protein